MAAAKRHDVGETNAAREDREDEQQKGERRKWRRDLVLVAALIVAILALGWWQSGQFAEDLRDASVEACERQNEVRSALVELLRAQNETSRATDPALFPDIPPDQFRDLIQEGVVTRKASIDDLHPTNCEDSFPEPTT